MEIREMIEARPAQKRSLPDTLLSMRGNLVRAQCLDIPFPLPAPYYAASDVRDHRMSTSA